MHNYNGEIKKLNQLVIDLLMKKMPPLTYYGYPFGFIWTSLFVFTGIRSQILSLHRTVWTKRSNIRLSRQEMI